MTCLIFIFSNDFPSPWKKKKKKQFVNGSSAELIKFSKKKKKKKKFHERFSLTKISIISFISKYLFFADYHKIAQNRLNYVNSLSQLSDWI